MGKRKWKAKRLEKKNRKLQQSKPVSNKRGKYSGKPQGREEETAVDINRDVDADYDDSGDEMAAARKMAAQRTKKKSGGFQSMGLAHNVLKGILRRGYKIPTPIQRKTIPIIMEGKDVVAMARTGSGKTAAFLIPLFERLKAHLSTGARAVIMSPTRELAMQTLKFAKEIGKFTGLKAAVVLGGDRMDDQFSALHDNPDIIIATPGRLLHVLVEMEMKLKSVEYVVFDEADRLFEMGFADQLQEVIHRLPESRQTVLFSATLPKSLVEFARAGLTDPTLIRLDVDSKLSDNLKLSFLTCRDADKCALLLYLLKNVIKPSEQTVVFAATKHHVEFLHMLLTSSGLSATYIYSSLDSAARKINAAKFSMGKVKILIVTDLAARGIDVPLLDNVINFHFPAKPKLFVHRVGRVARAGRSGVAYSLVSSDEMSHLVDLHTFLGRPLKFAPLEGTLEASEDGMLGEVPQSLMDDESSEIDMTMKSSVELTGLVKVCDNAYKKYIKSRPLPAPDSVRRVKKMAEDGIKLGIHPMFQSVSKDESGARLQMLNALKNYKPKTTIFEINSTSKKPGLEVMKAKREIHDYLICSIEAKRIEKDEATPSSSFAAATLSSSLPSTTKKKRKSGDEAEEKDIEAVFDQVVSSRGKAKPTKKFARNAEKPPTEVKDKENYIEYRPKDFASERGLSIGTSFERVAEQAVLDFTNDDVDDGNKKKRKWDRKRKKFVTESNSDPKKKKIKTESGNWINASYKSRAYEDWKHRTKFSERETMEDDDDNDAQRHIERRGGGGRFQVVGMRNRKFHTRGMEDSTPQGDKSKKQKFKPGKGGRIKSAEQILKVRRRKAKVQNFQKFRAEVKAKKRGDGGGGRGGKKR